MCGITGWIHFKKDLRNEMPIVAKMTETLKKRGPDDHNIWHAPHATTRSSSFNSSRSNWWKAANGQNSSI